MHPNVVVKNFFLYYFVTWNNGFCHSQNMLWNLFTKCICSNDRYIYVDGNCGSSSLFALTGKEIKTVEQNLHKQSKAKAIWEITIASSDERQSGSNCDPEEWLGFRYSPTIIASRLLSLGYGLYFGVNRLRNRVFLKYTIEAHLQPSLHCDISLLPFTTQNLQSLISMLVGRTSWIL